MASWQLPLGAAPSSAQSARSETSECASQQLTEASHVLENSSARLTFEHCAVAHELQSCVVLTQA